MVQFAVQNSPGRHLWFYWMLSCILILAIFLPQLSLWPLIGQDEVQIMEFGRVFLHPATDWSMNWQPADSTAHLWPSWLGVTLQDLAFRSSAETICGSRLSSLMGALLAGTMVLGWLTARRTPWIVGIVLAISFVLDPIFNESYRRGRIDGWAFAVSIAVCWLLRVAGTRVRDDRDIRPFVFIAGLLTGASPFVWMTTIALLPLVLMEFAQLLRVLWNTCGSQRVSRVRTVILWFIGGGLLSAGVLLAPLLVNLDHFIASLDVGVDVQTVASVIQRNIFDMYLLYDPMIILAVIASLLIRRDTGLLIALFAAVIMMFQTMIYPMRILYLLPYFVAMFAGASTTIHGDPGRPRRKVLYYCALGLLLSFSFMTSLIHRPLIANHQREARSPDQIRPALEQVVGPGGHRVLLEEWDMYPAARSLGWRIFKVFGRYPEDRAEAQAFLGSMDYVIKRNTFEFLVRSDEELKMAGFSLIATVTFTKPKGDEIRLGPLRFRAPDTYYRDVLIYGKSANEGSVPSLE